MNILDKQTGLTLAERNQLLKYYVGLKEEERLLVHADQTELLLKGWQEIKDKKLSRHVASYVSLLVALKIKHDNKPQTEKKESKLERLIRIKYFHDIKEQREKGASWREVSAYLKTYKKIKISYTRIRTIFTQLAGDKT